MGNPLPHLTQQAFEERLPDTAEPDRRLRSGWKNLLWQHYEEMRRWNPKLSLVGPGTAHEIVERHYVESLKALPLLDGEPKTDQVLTVLDVGTGGGFPGLVLAAARTDLDVVLMEPNQRKCAFLEAALRRLRRAEAEAQTVGDSRTQRAPSPLSCRVLNARVGDPADAAPGTSDHGWPGNVDLVTSRAVAWTPELHQSLLDCWPNARFLLWIGREMPEMPSAASVERDILLDYGRIVEIACR